MHPVVDIHSRSTTAPAEVAEAMADPGFYSPAPATVERRETHSSSVFLAGERAYKVKKPVRFEFLDYSTLPARRAMCGEEVRLNRRLAPATYLGVRSIARMDGRLALGPADQPGALEYAVEMRRFDEGQTLAAKLVRHSAGVEQVHDVAARVAEFHGKAEVVPADADPRIAVRAASSETFTSLLELVGASHEQDVIGAQRFTDSFLVRERDTMIGRAESGFVRDVHGDLRAEHVILGDPIEIVDCVEFDPALRQIDVASDLAFLNMDLHRLGAAELARELVSAYRAQGGDPGGDHLLAFYSAQRAWVRAKVELLRARQLEGSGAESARASALQLLTLGSQFAWHARQPLLLVICGLSGSGKTHLAGRLAAESGLEMLSSDPVRKRLAGLKPLQRAQARHYTPEWDAATYAELGRLAAAELSRSGGVIVDATFRQAADRRAFTAAAGEPSAHARFVECRAPAPLRMRRIQRRLPGASDATTAVAASQVFDELAEVPASRLLSLRTDRSAAACAAEVECWLDSPVP